MKKLIITTIIALFITFGVSAQNDGFFSDWENLDTRDETLPEFPSTHGSMYNSNTTPIGSGVLILTIIGIGYVALKRKDS